MPINEPSRLWGRKVQVQLNDELWDGLRVSFEVTKTLKGEPNKASISIYGIDTETYQNLLASSRELVVSLFAGHEIPGLIFRGNPVKDGLEYKIAAPERILQVEAKDGYRAYTKGRIKGSFKGEVRIADVVEKAAAQLGIPVSVMDIPGDLRLTQGIHLRGPAHRILDRLAQSTGADWSIQNGTLQFLPKSKVRRNSGPLYSPDPGLANMMERPTKKENGVELKVILDPGLTPGDRFEIRDSEYPLFNGVYKVQALRHVGDNWDTQFYTEIEAAEVKEPQPASNTNPEFVGTIFTDQYTDLLLYGQIDQQAQRDTAHSLLWETK
jgi:hypothetical protein